VKRAVGIQELTQIGCGGGLALPCQFGDGRTDGLNGDTCPSLQTYLRSLDIRFTSRR
jgi:hypothetical protein